MNTNLRRLAGAVASLTALAMSGTFVTPLANAAPEPTSPPSTAPTTDPTAGVTAQADGLETSPAPQPANSGPTSPTATKTTDAGSTPTPTPSTASPKPRVGAQTGPGVSPRGVGSAIKGAVWADPNLSQEKDSGEPYRSGVTVRLLDGAGASTGVTTTTDSNGAYTFADLADGDYVVEVVAPNGFTFATTAAGTSVVTSTGTPAVGDPETGRTDVITVSGTTQLTGRNAALEPVPALAINQNSLPDACEGIAQTGSGAWDATDGGGNDSGTSNCLVRNNDTTIQRYTVSASPLPTDAVVHNVIIEWKIVPETTGVKLSLAGQGTSAMPTGCLTSGVTPASKVTTAADGTVTVLCNLGEVNRASAIDPGSLIVRTGLATPNNSSWHTTARVYADSAEAQPSAKVTGPTISTTGVPRWDLAKGRPTWPFQGFDPWYEHDPASIRVAPSYRTIDGQSVRGYSMAYVLWFNNGDSLGNLPLKGPLTFTDKMPAYPGAVVTGCRRASGVGDINGYGLEHPGYISCEPGNTVQGNDGWQVTIGGFENNTGNDAYMFFVFIPESEVIRAIPGYENWAPGDAYPSARAISPTNTVINTENWADAAGTKNYGTGFEPGWNGTTASGNNALVSGPTLGLTPPVPGTAGSGKSYYAPYWGFNDEYPPMTSGNYVYSRVDLKTNADTTITNPILCDVFARSALKLQPGSTSIPSGYLAEYAAGPATEDLMSGPINNGNYPYDDSAIQASNTACRDFAGPWTTDPTTLGADWQDKVSMVRLRPIDPTRTLPPSSSLRLSFTLVARTTFNGGPHADQPIPTGIQLPNWGGWTTPTGTDGWSQNRVQLRFIRTTVGLTTVADQTEYLPGGRIKWTVTPSITNGAPDETVHAVTVTDTLPASLIYDAAATEASLPDGVSLSYNAATRQLTFTYGDRVNPSDISPTKPFKLPAVAVYTQVSPTQPPGTKITNGATVSTPDATASSGSKEVSVNGAGRLAIVKSVDRSLAASGETYTWSLDWSNSSADLDFEAPDVIDVLPWNGDNASGSASKRSSYGTNYTGTTRLTGALAQPTYTAGGTGEVAGTWYYSIDASPSVVRLPSDPSNVNPETPGGRWLAAAEVPNFDAVTAIRFVSNSPLRHGETVSAKVPQASVFPALNNVYVNNAELSSASFATQPLTSNEPYVVTPGFALGDRVWSDTNGNGKLDGAEAGVANVPVEVVNGSGTVVGTTTTRADGRWFVEALPEGTYTVRIPASAFAVGGPLAGYRVGTTGSVLTATSDEVADNNNTAAADPAATGLTSAPVTFGYTRDAQGFITGGGQPLGDNVARFGNSLIPDDFTNMTVDLAVLAPPTIGLTKVADQTTFLVGDTVTYTFTAENTGGVVLTNVAISETAFDGTGRLGALNCDKSTPTTLQPGGKLVCTATYVTTQLDLDRGRLGNAAQVVGTPPSGPDVTSASTVTITGQQAPAIDLKKSADRETFLTNDTITYTLEATNTGNTTLTKVAITDLAFNGAGTLTALACDLSDPVSLAPNAVLTCTTTYRATQADLDRGGLTNTGKVVGTAPSGAAVDDTATVTIDGTQTPSIQLVKSADRTSFVAGDTLTYTFKATNTGNATLTKVAISEDGFNGTGTMSSLDCDQAGSATLAPKAGLTCTATYLATQADVDRGNLANAAKVVGTPPSGSAVTDEDAVTVLADQTSSIELKKAADRPSYVAGDTVTYTFTATNTGHTTLSKVAITDTAFNGTGALSALACDQASPVSLAPNGSLTCTATYRATQADLDRGNLANTGHVVATPPSGPVVTDDDAVTIAGDLRPSISLTKTADRTDVAVGQTITYTLKATNTGNTTLNQVEITDTAFNGSGTLSALACDQTAPLSLAPKGVLTCTATYRTTQADVDRGNLVNSGHATGQPRVGPAVTADDDVTINGSQTPEIKLVKSASRTKYTADDRVTYTFKATNTGNTTLNNVAITDTAFNGSSTLGAMSCDKAAPVSLAPNGVLTCTATYVATLADVDRGNLANTGHAVGSPPTGPAVTSDDQITIAGNQDPKLAVEKTADKAKFVVGETITYTLKATNTGHSTLSNVAITDTGFDGTGALSAPSCDRAAPVNLPPNGVLTCTVTYLATQADLDRGSLLNSAHAVASPPAGPDLTGDDEVTVPADQRPGLVLNKAASLNQYGPGDAIRYTLTATNTGNTTLTSVAITETAFGGSDKLGPVSCDKQAPVALGPQEVLTCTATYVATQTDLDRGSLANSAHAVATPPSGPELTSDDDVTVPGLQQPGITLEKVADRSTYVTGDTVTYTMTATNTGNTTLTKVAITESTFNGAGTISALACDQPALVTLAPSEALTCTATYLVTQADLDRGKLTNSAKVVATPPSGRDVTDEDDATINGDRLPGITLLKTADRTDIVAGEKVTFTITATNTGNTTLSKVALTEGTFDGAGALSALTCDQEAPVSLAPAGVLTCTATYLPTQSDVDRGRLYNSAHVVATPPSGPKVTDDDDVTVDGMQTPGIEVEKLANRSLFAVGDQIDYTITATNAGNTTMSDVVVSDRGFTGSGKLSDLACDHQAPVVLAPGERMVCTASYVTTQADLNRGNLRNSAQVVATPPGGPELTDEDDLTIMGASNALLALDKRVSKVIDLNHNQITDAGDAIRWDFVLTNTGNVTLSVLEVVDPFLARAGIAISCPGGRLAPGAKSICTSDRDYIITKADAAKGMVLNTASARAAETLDEPVISRNDTTRTTVTPTGVLGVEDPGGTQGGGNGRGNGRDLAFTGFDNAWMITAAGLFAIVGAGFVLVARRRRAGQED